MAKVAPDHQKRRDELHEKFAGLGLVGYWQRQREHHTVNHRRRQFADGDCYTNGIESFWATVKRSHKGTYHSWSHKHLQRYLDEFCGRQNMRHKNTLCQMRAVIRGMVGKRLLYRELTGRVSSR